MQHIKQWLGLQFGEGLHLQGTPARDGMRIWHDLHLEIKGAGYTGRQISDVAISGAMQALLNLDGALGGEPWVGLNPREALILQTAPESLIRNARPMRELLQDIGRALTIFEDAGHWALLAVQEEDGRLVATVYNGHTIMPATAENLLGKLAELWDRPTGSLTLHTDYAQTKPDQCGVIALQHTCRVLGLWDAFNEEITETWHDWLLEADTDESAWRAAGPEDKVMRDLAAVLIQQGVPGNKVEDRAAEAIKKIGSVQIQQALNQPNPWQALKGVGNQAAHRFRCVQPVELEAQIQSRASTKFGAAKPRQRKEPKPQLGKAPQIQEVDPMGVVIKEGIFEDENEEVVKQIQLSEVAVNARGLAITCIAEALPFLKAQNSISPDALGLLTTQPLPDELRGGLNITDVQFPALYKDTQEAILLRGTLIDVGDLRIAKKANPSAPAIELVDTVIVKIIGYRDEMDDHWERVLASPAKTLMDKLDALHLCKTPLCKGHCRAYHAAVEEDINQVVQDVWGRSFQKMAGGKTDPSQAEMVQIFARIPRLALRQLNQESGRTGVYIEPRAESTLGPCPGFAVVWLPGKTLAEAQHIMATHEKALGIARLGQKWGIRVKTEDEAMLFGALRPGQIFMQLKLNAIYKVYPLPYGMQRAGVVALMKQWGWAAKPLQPARGSAAGGAWEVGAEKDPPSFAMQGPQGEVLIQLVKSLNRKTDGHPAPVIPQRTRQYLQSDKQGVKPKHGGSNTQDP